MNTKIFIGGGLVVIGVLVYIFTRPAVAPKDNSVTDTSKTSNNIEWQDTTVAPVNENNTQINSSNPTEIMTEQAPVEKTRQQITLNTNKGIIVFETYENDAPNTVKNFVKLANDNFYDGVIFHRVIKGFMIQGGDPTGTGTGGPGYRFDDELHPNTESYKNGYKRGVVAMANAGPNTNGSQFFIMHADTPLPNHYTIFGRVISGLEVVDTIANVPTNQNDKPLEDVVINDVKVEQK